MEQKASVIGGSFAPRITAEKVAEYRQIAEGVQDAEIKDNMLRLCTMMDVWLETPDVSGGPTSPLRMPITPLPSEEVSRIWDVVPWPSECKLIGNVFEPLTDPVQRNAAFHLLWYAVELSADRQPCTKDLLPASLQ